MSNGDDLTYENEIRKIRVSLTDVEDAKKVADNLMTDFLNKELAKINKDLAKEEAIKSEADYLMINKVEKYEAQIKDLKKEIDRIQESYDNLKIIDDGHQKLNGELQTKVNKLEKDKKILEVKLEKQLKEFRNKGDL